MAAAHEADGLQRNLLLPRPAEGLDLLEVEEVDDDGFPTPPPVLVVWGERHIAAAVDEGSGGGGEGPGDEGDVLGLEHLPRRLHGGDNEGGGLPEVEEHEGAVLAGELTEGAVRQGAELVEIADEGEFGRGRREAEALLVLRRSSQVTGGRQEEESREE
ncbi:unnamed protein product [Spirodela intermedia]|uniref:Uncharacterized protein n=1 Tax=Spirodela intermedia TaxID=51605 RepID=A0A7I8L5H1_SPIIN|nr:unnamed protein product [Spirodela intermedia]